MTRGNKLAVDVLIGTDTKSALYRSHVNGSTLDCTAHSLTLYAAIQLSGQN